MVRPSHAEYAAKEGAALRLSDKRFSCARYQAGEGSEVAGGRRLAVLEQDRLAELDRERKLPVIRELPEDLPADGLLQLRHPEAAHPHASIEEDLRAGAVDTP